MTGFRSGPDPNFPWLDADDRYQFPPPSTWKDSVIAVGGNLSPGMLLSAYEQGIFPWFNREDPILWQSPDPRFVIFPENLHISDSMRKVLRRGEFEIVFDHDFSSIIKACAEVERPGQSGTWITDDIIAAYAGLHRLGWAHSAEAWQNGELAGGCYGIRLGRVFFGESMFAQKPNASKAAFLSLAQMLFADGVAVIDCQVPSEHLRSLGGREMARNIFIALLNQTVGTRGDMDRRGNWGRLRVSNAAFESNPPILTQLAAIPS